MIVAGFDTVERVQRHVRDRLSADARFAWLIGDRVNDAPAIRYALSGDGGLEHYSAIVEGPVPSLTDVALGARWHEREVHDRYGVAFTGLDEADSLLVPHDPALLRMNHSDEVSTVLYGPVRSGILESACWVVETAGEDFLRVTPSMFYKHRDIEKRFVGTDLDTACLIAEHVSGATAISHASGFARAAERALKTRVSQRGRATRAILIEFERIHQHLDSLAKLADDGSLSVGSTQVYAAKERVHRLLAEATGSRFARGVICVGGTRFDAMERLREVCGRTLDALERETLHVVELLFSTQSLIDRLVGTGRLPGATILAYAGVGPVARGSGVSCDARLHDALFTPVTGEEAIEHAGDALARALVRRREIVTSFRLIRNALDAAPSDGFRENVNVQDGVGFSRVESPQGELLYFTRFESGLANVAIRSASYQNWPLFAQSLPGNIFTDFSFIEHSFGSLQAEVDR
ncbi:MAG: hydrogenase large subunit [Vulcanimicrobiaceae bacterium]